MRKLFPNNNILKLNDASLLQAIAESETVYDDSQFDSDRIAFFQRRVRICELLNTLEFTIENYGLVNLFIDYDYLIDGLMELHNLLQEFDLHEATDAISKLLDFYTKNKSEFEYLENDPTDYDEKFEELQDRISKISNNTNSLPFHLPLHKCITVIASHIRLNPNDFFVVKNFN